MLTIQKYKEYSWDKKQKTRVFFQYENGDTSWDSIRNIVDRWEDYEGEVEHQRQEQAEKTNKRMREDIRTSIIETAIKMSLVEKGLPATIEVDFIERLGRTQITLGQMESQLLLGLNNQQIEQLVERAMNERATV